MAAATIYNLIAARLTTAATTKTISFKQAAEISGLSESHLRFLSSDCGGRKIKTVKVGRRRLVNRASLENLIRS